MVVLMDLSLKVDAGVMQVGKAEEQRDALIALCGRPDEDGYTRRFRRTQDGDPARASALLRFQPVTHVVYQVVERQNERLA